MQAVPPPEPVQQCARAPEQITGLISVSGSAKQMQAFADVLKRYPRWRKEGEGSGSNDNRLVVLRGPASLPYREIGGLIYEAQVIGLAVTLTPSAPLCEDQVK